MSYIYSLIIKNIAAKILSTRFKLWICAVILLFTGLSASGQQTWYSYRTGDWNHDATWTTDPGGTTLVGNHTPQNGNSYVILAGRTVSLTENITQSSLSLTINDGGILQMNEFEFVEQLDQMDGQGTIRLKSTSLPIATTNSFILAGGGTFEFNNSENFILPGTTYNNLTLNLTEFGNIATALSDATLNGNLSVTRGVFRINDDATAGRHRITINGNVTVASGSSVTVGTGNTASTTDPSGITGGTAPFVNYYINNTHTVEVSGNFTNNGTVRFTNQAHPVYDAFPENGAASVFFRGAGNSSLTANGTTDFYNLIVDKGTDQTYELSISSSEYQNFRLFGANISDAEGDDINPVIKKALWIRNGSLKLFGRVVIPSLSEGNIDGTNLHSDYIIPLNAALIIEGPDVTVLTTASDYREVNAAYGVSITSNDAAGINPTPQSSPISILGKFQINNGYLSTRQSAGLIYHGTSAGEFIINGGTLDARQLRTAGSSGGLTAYRQTGGTFSLRGRLTQDASGVTTVPGLRTIPLSGNRNEEGLQSTVGTFNIDRDDNIFEMTGGTIKILDVPGTSGEISSAFEVNSLPENYNVTGGTILIKPTTAGGTDLPYYLASSSPLYNLHIERESGSQPVRLTNIPEKEGVTPRLAQPLSIINDFTLTNDAVFDAAGYELQVAGDFIMQAGTTYVPGGNTTTFNGNGNQAFTGDGTIQGNFTDLKIDKSAGTITMEGSPPAYTVNNSLSIIRGTLDDGGKTINVGGNIYTGGIHTGEGRIVLNGTTTQTIEADIFGTPELGNVELHNTSNPGVQLLSDLSIESLTLNANTGELSIFDNQKYRLTLTGGVVLSEGPLAFGADKMVRTDGSMSARGLRVNLNLTGASSPDYLFPVGVGTGTNNNYSPFILLTPGNPGTTSGYLTVTPVNNYHPTVSNTDRVIPFYWSVKAEGFVGADAGGFQYYFNYFENIANNLNKASYLDYNDSNGWVEAGDVDGNGDIEFSAGLGFLSTDFTAGNNSAFNQPRILYSIGDGNWNIANVWSTDGHTGAATNKGPETFDRIVIGGSNGANHQITMSADLTSVAGVEILGTDVTGIAGTPPTLIKPDALTTGYSLTFVTGGGRYQQYNQHLPEGDFEDFSNNETAIFEYAGGEYDISSALSSYPNLHITSNAINSTKTLPDANIMVRQNLRLLSASPGSKLQFNASTTARTLTVYGDAEFTNTSQLIIPATSGQKTINIYGDINFRYNNTDNVNGIVASSGTGTIHNLNFYGSTITSGNSQLAFYNGTGTNQLNLNLLGEGNATITNTTGTGATTNFILNGLTINKSSLTDNIYFQNNFTLGAPAGGTTKALELNTGTLHLEHSETGINLSSDGAPFRIPQTSALILRNGASVNVTGNNTGIFLDGLLRAEGTSTINLGDGSTDDNRYIEYSGSGNAAIELTGSSTLTVNSQIRRGLLQTNGILSFTQSLNSETIIYGRGVSQTRAKLEIVNSGSSFSMSDNSKLTIVRGGGTNFGDLYLRPSSANVSGGEINIGSTTGGQTFQIDANSPLNNLNIVSPATANTVQLMINPLRLNGSLAISTNSIFNANNIDVFLKGDLTNNGTYSYGSEGNTTTFEGITQTIKGDEPVTFHNLVVSPETSLTLIRNQIIESNLTINSGIISTGTYNIEVKGNLTNNSTHSSSTGRLILNGTSGNQGIYGTGTFGILELDNNDGARINNNISLTEDFYLTKGVLNINQHLLTLGPQSNIIIPAGQEFGPERMIAPDGVFSNIGIKKHFPASFSGEFTYPLGVTGAPNKYTPAKLTIMTTNEGYVRINAINQRHPATLEPLRVLDYYWEAEGLVTGFTGNLILEYDESDVRENAEDEALYVAARVVEVDEGSWSKAATGPETDNVDEVNNEIYFGFDSASNLGGEYTAGRDEDIPEIIPTFYSNAGEVNWDNSANWTPVAPDGGPNGFNVVISENSTVRTNGNRRFAYQTTIQGKLEIGETYGHNLGTVNGTGTLSLEDQTLPAGRYTNFFTCAGGTLEFGGSKDYTIIADRLDTLRNLHFTGTGKRILPNKDLVICNELLIGNATEGPEVINESNRQLTIGGTMVLNNGTFLSGTGEGATVKFAGLSPQTLAGFNQTTLSTLNNLEIDNPEGLTLNSQIDINGNLKLTRGIITTTSENILYMRNSESNTSVTPEGGSASSYVSGPMRKYVYGGNDFIFPSGKGNRYGRLTLKTPTTGNWTAEYFNSGYPSAAFDTPLNAVSSTEHWQIISPNNTDATAKIQLRWDGLSDISPLSTSGGINDIRTAEFDGSVWVAKESTATGNNSAGTVETNQAIPVKQSGHPQFYTLGSVTEVTAMARFAFTGEACEGTIIPLTFSGVTSDDLNYEITYTIDNGPELLIEISALPYPGIPATSPGPYKLTGFSYRTNGTAVTGNIDNTEVTINPSPDPPSATDVARCGPGTVELSASGADTGEDYLWYTAAAGGTLLQTGGNTFTTPYISTTTDYYVARYNTTSGCESARPQVSATINSIPVFTVTGSAEQICQGESFTLTINFTSVNTPYRITLSENTTLIEDGTLDFSDSQYIYQVDEMEWNGSEPGKVYSYTVSIEDANGCLSEPIPPLNVTVWKIPETGPQYHIPNTFGQ